jgi:hypothetical protein
LVGSKKVPVARILPAPSEDKVEAKAFLIHVPDYRCVKISRRQNFTLGSFGKTRRPEMPLTVQDSRRK